MFPAVVNVSVFREQQILENCAYYEKYTTFKTIERYPNDIRSKILKYAKIFKTFKVCHKPWTWTITLFETKEETDPYDPPLAINFNIIKLNGCYMIEVQRRRGSSMLFNEIYSRFKALYSNEQYTTPMFASTDSDIKKISLNDYKDL